MQKQNTENAGGKRRKRERKFYSSEADSAEKEKRDKKMKVVHRLWKQYVGEKVERAGRRKYSQRRAENTKQGGSRASGSYTRAGKRKACTSMRKCRWRPGAAL